MNLTYPSEHWKPVPNLPGVMASDVGRLLVLPYKLSMPNGGERTYAGKPTRGVWAKDERRRIWKFRGKTYRVAPLICAAFNGIAPKDKPYCLHKDEDSRNNAPWNLQWGTQKENLNMPKFIAYCKTRIGSLNPRLKAA